MVRLQSQISMVYKVSLLFEPVDGSTASLPSSTDGYESSKFTPESVLADVQGT